jgi:hypothetical protein
MIFTDKTRRMLEIAANVAILVVAIIIVRNFVLSKWLRPQQLEAPTIGTKISFPGSKWEEGTTLVMALQKGCRYCEESSSFYRRLREQRAGVLPRMVAVVPGNKTEIASYLSHQGIIVDDIVNASLSDIKVSYTPTLLLVDRSGSVTDVWIGKLDARKESEVIQRVSNSK